MRAFLAEKGADCTSPKLKEAVSKVMETAVGRGVDDEAGICFHARGRRRRARRRGRRKTKGCAHNARELYDFVLRNFAGLGYAALRERATVGIKDFGHNG